MTGIGFCGRSASCDITYETGGTSSWHWVLFLVISYARLVVLLPALDSASCDITRETGGTICYGNWVLRLVITETAGTTCFGHCFLRLVMSYTRQKEGFNTGVRFCVLRYHTRDNGYVWLWALGSASCDITDETGDTICYENWILHLVISYTRQGVRFNEGIGFCIL